MKIALEVKHHDYKDPLHIKSCKPFIVNNRATLIHRPRSVSIHKIGPKWPHHIAFTMWCGSGQVGDFDKFDFVDQPPPNRLVCAVCEERALMSGQKSSDQIVGRHVHKGRMKPIQTCCSLD